MKSENISIFTLFQDIIYNGAVSFVPQENVPYWYKKSQLLQRKNLHLTLDHINT